MTDPLDVLRQPLVPLDPDPAFAARLRDRIRRALTRPEGAAMSTSAPVTTMADGDVVYLSLQVPDAARAREFYREVLGWRFGSGPETDRDNNPRQVQGQALHIGVWDGPPYEGVGSPGVFIVRRVADLAAAVRRVRELGGTATDPQENQHGLMSDCLDDQGNGFTLMQMPADEPRSPENGEGPGDVSYITLAPGDETRASRFYGDLFGWEFSPGHVPHGLNVSGPRPMTGMWGGTGRQRVTPVFTVSDVERAVRRVRDLGGTATDPYRQPYGLIADCADNQGLAFSVVSLAG